MKLENKVALITGGSRGIGKAVAAAFAREGAKLALCARSADELQQTVAELRRMKAQAQGWTCDVTMESSVKISSTRRKGPLVGSIFWSTMPAL